MSDMNKEGNPKIRFCPAIHLNQTAVLLIILFSVIMSPAKTYGNEIENGSKKLLQSCQVALELLDNDETAVDIESVRFCDDYLTGFREDENVKEIYMGGHYHRGYCFPYSGITNGQLARVIVNYLQTYKYEQNLAANTVIRNALAEGYPCRN
jgi:hypothetical protein